MASKICRTTSGARPSDGSSSSNSRGRAISARAIASICCSPPESVPPRWPRRCFRRGNSVSTRSRSDVNSDGLGGGGAHLQILQHRHAREDAAAFRRLRELEPRDLVGRHAGDVAAGEFNRALAGARIAADRHHQRGFAGAVGADQRDDLALVDLEIDALERHHAAVEGLHAAHRQERSCHGAASLLPPLKGGGLGRGSTLAPVARWQPEGSQSKRRQGFLIRRYSKANNEYALTRASVCVVDHWSIAMFVLAPIEFDAKSE